MEFCVVCNKSYKTKESLRKHTSSFHTNQETKENKMKKHLCQTCGRSYSSSIRLASHMYQMHEKGNATNPSVELSQSSSKPMPKTIVKCQICERSFTTKESLYSHKSRFHRNPPLLKTKSYSHCSLCRIEKTVRQMRRKNLRYI